MTSPLNSADLLDEGVTETPGNCDLHGPYTAKTYSIAGRSITPDGCPVCNAEKSAIAKAKREEEDRRQRQFERMRKVASLMGHAGIPRRFQDKTFDGYMPANRNAGIALTACRKYAETFPAQMEQGRSLILAGGPGTGKTHLATAIGLHVINEFQAVVVFDPVSHALRRIKETYRPNAERTESQILAGYAECDLLILDEIGAQIGSEHEKQLMFEILNSRYQDMRPTILISNLNAQELEDFMGHRVMDRYRECGVVLAFDWPSHRGQKPVDAKTKAGGHE